MLLGLAFADMLVLPAAAGWAIDNGPAGWLIWLVWAAGTVVCVDLALIRRLWRRAIWGLYATGGITAWMAITGPDTWGHALLELLATGYIWLLFHLAAGRAWPGRTAARRVRPTTTTTRTRA